MMNHTQSSTERIAPTTTIETVTVVRPLKVLAFVCGIISAVLVLIAVASTEWLTTSGYRQGLWHYCAVIPLAAVTSTTMAPDTNNCLRHESDKAWVHGSAALSVIGLIVIVVAVVLCGVGLALKSTDVKFKLYRVAMYLLFGAAVLLIIGLIVFPIMAIQELNARPITRKYWEFAWAYGIAWGGAVFTIGSAVLLLFGKESEEIYYKERVHHYHSDA